MKLTQYWKRLSLCCGAENRAGACSGMSTWGVSSPRRPATIPAMIRTSPWAPASTTPASASTSSWSGVLCTACSPASVITSSTAARIWSCCSWLSSGLREMFESSSRARCMVAELAIALTTVSIVPSAGLRTDA